MSTPSSRSVPIFRGFSWLRHGAAQLIKNPVKWILGSIALVIFGVGVQFIPYFGPLAANLFSPAVFAGFLFASFRQEREGSFAWSDFFFGFRARFWRLFLLGLLILLAMVLAFAFAGFIAVSLGGFANAPGGIAGGVGNELGTGIFALLGFAIGFVLISFPLFMMFWFAIPLVAFAEASFTEAFTASFIASWRNMFPMFFYALGLALLFVIALIPFGAGILLALPIYFSSFAKSYSEIFGSDPLQG